MNNGTIFRIFRWMRIIAAGAVFALSLLLFMGVSSPALPAAQRLIDLQFMPLLTSLTAGQITAATVIGFAGIILLTLLFGRVYCSILCPFGILQDIIGGLGKLFSFRRRKRRYKTQPARKTLWICVLLITGFSVVLGFILPVLVLDPYALFGRIATGIFAPAFTAINNLLVKLTPAGQFSWLYPREMPTLSLVAVVFAAAALLIITVAVLLRGRLFCNSLCPAGAILRLLSRFSLFRLIVGESSCGSCGLCAAECKAGCIDPKQRTIDFERCVMCMNCGTACRFCAVKIVPFWKSKKQESTLPPANPSRRDFILSTGVTTAIMLTAPPLLSMTKAKKLPIMPPGAQNIRHFQSKCVACHLCVSACPNKVIKPSTFEYGLSGFMQPKLDFNQHMCEYNCTICSNVCPTGALVPLTRDLKRVTQIGKVEYRQNLCIVQTQSTDCGACAEHCPTQAVKMVPWKNGLNIPVTDVSICIGCGCCEYICPVTPVKAIVVHGVEVQELARKPDAGKAKKDSGNDFPF